MTRLACRRRAATRCKSGRKIKSILLPWVKSKQKQDDWGNGSIVQTKSAHLALNAVVAVCRHTGPLLCISKTKSEKGVRECAWMVDMCACICVCPSLDGYSRRLPAEQHTSVVPRALTCALCLERPMVPDQNSPLFKRCRRLLDQEVLRGAQKAWVGGDINIARHNTVHNICESPIWLLEYFMAMIRCIRSAKCNMVVLRARRTAGGFNQTIQKAAGMGIIMLSMSRG